MCRYTPVHVHTGTLGVDPVHNHPMVSDPLLLKPEARSHKLASCPDWCSKFSKESVHRFLGMVVRNNRNVGNWLRIVNIISIE